MTPRSFSAAEVPLPAGRPTIVPKVEIGDWDPCFKPGPCPCPNPCTWVAALNRPRPSPAG
jgi:hypothetical protein